MKKIILILVGALFITLSAQGRQRVLEELDNVDDVERVYIGPAMLATINVNGLTGMGKDGIQNLQGMEILTASTKSASKHLKAAFTKFVEKNKYPLVTEIQDGDGGFTRIYARKVDKKNPNRVSTVIIEQNSRSSLTLIAIDADVNINELM